MGNGNANGTFSGAIKNTTGAVAVTKAGTGTLTLAGSDTYSGGTTLSAGQLNINAASALGTGPFTISGGTIGNTSGAAITLSTNNAQNWNGDFAFAGTNDLNLGTGAVTMSSSRTVTVASNTLTVGGVIGGSGYSLTKAGAGTLILTGSDTYTGLTTVSGGILQIGAGGAAGSINGTSGVADNAVLAFSRSDSVTFSKVISGSGSVTMLGPGALVLSAADTYTGGTTISGGTLQLGNAAALGSTSGAATVSGGVLDLHGYSLGVGALSGAGTINNLSGAGTYTLTVGNGNASSVFSGTIQDTSGTISLAKTGTGTLTLAGADTYTGGTTISGGTLLFEQRRRGAGQHGDGEHRQRPRFWDGHYDVHVGRPGRQQQLRPGGQHRRGRGRSDRQRQRQHELFRGPQRQRQPDEDRHGGVDPGGRGHVHRRHDD